MSKIDHSLFSVNTSEETFGLCPRCNAKLNVRRGKSGAFIGCSHYPECDFSKPLYEYENADIKSIEGSACPVCQSHLVIKKGRFGLFIGCSKFPVCDFIESNSNSEDTQLSCPLCKKGHITKRANKFGKSFYACDTYPRCKYLLNLPPVDHPCPECHWPVMQEKKGATGIQLICPQKQCLCKIPKPA